MTQEPIREVRDHACPVCGSTAHWRPLVSPGHRPIPWVCSEYLARSAINRVRGGVR